MPEVTHTFYVRVVTLEPLSGVSIPLPGAEVRVQHDGVFSNPDLTTGSPVTGEDEANRGIAEVEVHCEDSEAGELEPFITITLPAAQRRVPADAPPDQQLELPETWRERRRRRLPELLAHNTRENPAEVVVGFPAHLGLSWADFHRSGLRNPLALPAHTLQVRLVDTDICFDDTLQGFGVAVDPESRAPRLEAIGNEDGDNGSYPYHDAWPTAPEAMAILPQHPDTFLTSSRGWVEPPRPWLDPPGAPVGALGGGSFEQTGPLATDSRGFVFMIDGFHIRCFTPDGTLFNQTELTGVRGDPPIDLAVSSGGGHLFVVKNQRTRGRILALHRNAEREYGNQEVLWTWADDAGDPLSDYSGFHEVRGITMLLLPDGTELLAAADVGIASNPNTPNVYLFDLRLEAQATVGRTEGDDPPFTHPALVTSDDRGRLFVFDEGRGELSAWSLTPEDSGLITTEIWRGSAGEALEQPRALAADGKNGILYLATTSNIHRFDAATGEALGIWTPPSAEPSSPEPSSEPSVMATTSMAVDPRGEIYLAESEQPRVRRFTRFTAVGEALPREAEPRQLAEPWLPISAEHHLSAPGYLMFDIEGQLWVSDTGNNRVLRWTRNAQGELERSHLLSADLDRPTGLVRGPEGELFVVLQGAGRIRRYAPSLETSEDLEARFRRPAGIAIGQLEDQPRLFVADPGLSRVAVLGLDGEELEPLTTDGATAFSEPEDVAVDSRHNLYVADTGNQRIVCFPAAGGGSPRAIVLAAHDLSFSQPCGVAVDDEDHLLITDRQQNTVFHLATDGILLGFWDLERLLHISLKTSIRSSLDGSVALSSAVVVEPTTRHLGQAAWRVTVGGELTVTSSDPNQDPVSYDLPAESILLVEDGQAVAASQRLAAIAHRTVFHPDLARLVQLSAPARAAVDHRGLLAVADTGNHRVRLMRIRTHFDLNLFDLGEDEPDIAYKLHTRADWRSELGLRLAVGDDVDRFGEAYELVSDPRADGTRNFTGESFHRRELLGPVGQVHAAINGLAVVRQAQRWHGHLTAGAEDEQNRWTRREGELLLDLSDEVEWSATRSWRDHIGLARDLSGRGRDVWDDGVVAHEMGHWVFSKLVPRRVQRRLSSLYGDQLDEVAGDHYVDQKISQVIALLECFAEYPELFWHDTTDRVRGFPFEKVGNLWTGPFHDQQRVELFESPEQGLENEGYLTNTRWQIFHALVDPGILFADSPGYWYARNLCLTEALSRRAFDLLRGPLRAFETEDLSEQPVTQYLTAILAAARQREEPSDVVQTIQSIFELNNQLMPRIVFEDPSSGSAAADTIDATEGEAKHLLVKVTDATGEPLRGYNLRFHIEPGEADFFSLRSGPGPQVRHGIRTLDPDHTAEDRLRATKTDGSVDIDFTAPAGTASTEHTLTVSYRPDFDHDETFFQELHEDDDWQTTLQKLYLRKLGRSGPPQRRGAEVSRAITVRVG